MSLLLLLACSGSNAIPGRNGAAGADGAPGLACWDTNSDGSAQSAEDINADGAWNTADCQGAPALSLHKGLVYQVVERVEEAPYDATARCRDETDILLAGGCTAGDDSGEEYAPQVSFGPIDAESMDQPAGYWCWFSAATGPSHWLEATATCLSVE